VRDVLYVNDLIDAYEMAYKKIKESGGKIYNIGGGAGNQISILESIKIIEKELKIRKIYMDCHAPPERGSQ